MNIATNTKKILIWLLFLINLSLVFVFWWLGSSHLLLTGQSPEIFIALGRLTGLLAEFFILTLLILISRAPFIERVYGFDKLNILHRRIGYVLVIAIISHPLFLTIGYAQKQNISLGEQFLNLFMPEDIAKAFIGLLIIFIVGIISYPYIRKKLRYGIWHSGHLLMYLAIGLAFGHQVNEGDVSYGLGLYYWYIVNFSVFGTLILYRFLSPIILSVRHSFRVEKIVRETTNVYSVYISGQHMDRFKFEAGQYINVSFLAKKLWEPHPFSLSIAPNGKYIRLTIKALGDFTDEIKNLRAGTRVLLERPLGRFTERAAINNKYLFIAGGIGITPIRSLIESLATKKSDMILLYANKTEGDMVFKDELVPMISKHYNIFSESDSTDELERGYIDEKKIRHFVPDIVTRDIYLCGPSPMMNSILKILSGMGIKKSRIHYEVFAY